MSSKTKRNEKKISKPSRPKSSEGGTQPHDIPLQHDGMLLKQPDQLQTIAQMKMLFRNFVKCEMQKKIRHTDEKIEVTSKMLGAKKDLHKQCSQELHHIKKMFRKCAATTLKKTKAFEKMRQTYEANIHIVEQSHIAFFDLFGLNNAKELQVAEIRARHFDCTDKVNKLKGELKDLQDNFKRMSDKDESLNKALAEDKERYEHILRQNNEIEDNLAKIDAEEQNLLDTQIEITNELSNIKKNILVANTTTAQNRAEITNLIPICDEIRNIVTSTNDKIEQTKQQIEMDKIFLVDSRVENRFQICALQQSNNDIKAEIEKAEHLFNVKRNEIIENIRLETERVQRDQQIAVATKQAIEMPSKTIKRKSTTTPQSSQHKGNGDILVDLANTSIDTSSSSNLVDGSFLISKRAKITSKSKYIMQATFDSDSDSDNSNV